MVVSMLRESLCSDAGRMQSSCIKLQWDPHNIPWGAGEDREEDRLGGEGHTCDMPQHGGACGQTPEIV